MNILDVLFEKSGYRMPPHPSTLRLMEGRKSTQAKTAPPTAPTTTSSSATQQTGGATTAPAAAASAATQQTGGASATPPTASLSTTQQTGGSAAAKQTATKPTKPNPILTGGTTPTTQATQTSQPTQQQPQKAYIYDLDEILVPFSVYVGRPGVYFVSRPQHWLSPRDTVSTEELRENTETALQNLSQDELTNLAHLGVLLSRSSDIPTQQIGTILITEVQKKNINIPTQPDLVRISQARIPHIEAPTETPEDWSNKYEPVSVYLWRIVDSARTYLDNQKIQPTQNVQVLPRQGGSWSGGAATDWSSYLGPAIGALLGAGIAGLAAPEQNKWLYVVLGALLGGGGGYVVQQAMQ